MKIMELTSEQKDKLDKLSEYCRKVLVCTDPADFDRAESIIADLYARIGEQKPIFFRFSSPMECCLWINKIKVLPSDMDYKTFMMHPLRFKIWSKLESKLIADLKRKMEWHIRDYVMSKLLPELDLQMVYQMQSHISTNLLCDMMSMNDSYMKTKSFIANVAGGHYDSYWAAQHSFASEIGVKYRDGKLIEYLRDLAESCFWWVPWKGVCVISDRPRHVVFDEKGRLHNKNGMAVRFSDGWGVYANLGNFLSAMSRIGEKI